jgi:glyoxylase-like metal-dependent hydrolase (beta-lactamase superfamily II)
MRATRSLCVLLALGALTTGCAASRTVGKTAEGAPIVQISFLLSNAYLVKSERPILIDAGSAEDTADLDDALAEHGVSKKNLGLVILTHGHADHAGLARHLQQTSPARVAVGEGDLPLVTEGRNDAMNPTNATAHVLKACLSHVYPRFRPDYVVREREPVSLSAFGIDGKVMSMPGHTAGSVVVVLGNRSAFVGDMMLGGSLGGALSPESPGEHYFHADKQQNRKNIEELLRLGVETFYLGHGGPVKREDVLKELGGSG